MAHAYMCTWEPEEILEALELELYVVVSCPTQVLGPELILLHKSSTLNC